MVHPRSQRGTTLLEAMVALVVLLIGAIGIIGAHRQGLRLASDARRITRASAIAQDLVDQIALWPYGDPRLVNANTSNDTDIGDSALALEASTSPTSVADYSDENLTLGGKPWNGIPADVIQAQGYQRFWNVSYVDDMDGDGVKDAVRIAVIVRWGDPGAGYRSIVTFTSKANPQPTP